MDILNTTLVIVLVMNLLALGTSHVLTIIRVVAAQGALLGLLPIFMHEHVSLVTGITIGVTVLLKGAIIPGMMLWAFKGMNIKREVEPTIALRTTTLLGGLATAAALLFASALPQLPAHAATLLLPTAGATVFCGFLLLIARYKALTQVMGYLLLENGIFIFGLMLVEAMPFVIEMGVLLDLFAAVFVTCIIVNQINTAFSSLDTRHLATLKE